MRSNIEEDEKEICGAKIYRLIAALLMVQKYRNKSYRPWLYYKINDLKLHHDYGAYSDYRRFFMVF